MLLDLIHDLICFEQISHPGLSLPSLEHFHNELKGIEQLLCHPLQTSTDALEIELVIQLFHAFTSQTNLLQIEYMSSWRL